ncbi:EAL domain-containing protein [Alicyclobacillus sp. SO9]|uniref:EAL domain-containing protein n=1 Tax=Alicyclobacillus sp. SO9 TaxID=2665646 RepID=UPI0018E8A8E7|nr:EAL domain-containing protein [Alicyclobacillus sp. SO9]QQE80075.1 EAL domain-containing protein [Alicyclobacillus sp. SO9]
MNEIIVSNPDLIDKIPSLFRDTMKQFEAAHPRVESVLFIDIVGFSRFEQFHGGKACEDVLQIFEGVLTGILFEGYLPWSELKPVHLFDDSFAVVFCGNIVRRVHEDIIHRFVRNLESKFHEALHRENFDLLSLRYGSASRSDVQSVSQEQVDLFTLVTQAGRIARRYTEVVSLSIVEQLQYIINEKAVTVHYQPIWDLKAKTIIGWEGLVRGPDKSDLQAPKALFSAAERCGWLLDVERLCRNTAIREARISECERLFLNISPNILADPSFRQGETLAVLKATGLQPNQIVFEITEHHAIEDYQAFLQLVRHYKEQGYKIAIDDVGAGHSGLVTLMQVKPDFVKIDMSLIQGIESDRTKQDIVRAIHQISIGFSGEVIAEGIETPEELECVEACGIPCGQGFLLGRPGPYPQ